MANPIDPTTGLPIDYGNVDIAGEANNDAAQLSQQLGRPLTNNELLTITDNVRIEHGYPSSYSAPLPGVTTEFLAAAATFSSSVLQRIDPIPGNSTPADLGSDYEEDLLAGDAIDTGDTTQAQADAASGIVPTDNLYTTSAQAATGAANVAASVAGSAANLTGAALNAFLANLGVGGWVIVAGLAYLLYVTYL
jgi:hypothetical protein